MEPDSKVAKTHINAFHAELAEAENELAQAKNRVDQLKETIATMEQEARKEEKAKSEGDESQELETADQLKGLKRPELEAEAKAAGIENPDDKEEYPNKDVLADATAKAKGNGDGDQGQEPSDAPVDEAPTAEPQEPVPAHEENPHAEPAPAGHPERPVGDDQAPEVPTESGNVDHDNDDEDDDPRQDDNRPLN